jgi:hypothetical protein
MVTRSAEAIADQERAHDLQRTSMLAEARVRQSASETHAVLVQAECRVYAAQDTPEQFAIDMYRALRNAIAGQQAVVIAETSEYHRLEARERINTYLSQRMSLKVLDAEMQRELNEGFSRMESEVREGQDEIAVYRKCISNYRAYELQRKYALGVTRSISSSRPWNGMRPLRRPTLRWVKSFVRSPW